MARINRAMTDFQVVCFVSICSLWFIQFQEPTIAIATGSGLFTLLGKEVCMFLCRAVRCSWLFLFCGLVAALSVGDLYAQEETADTGAGNLPENRWVQVAKTKRPVKYLSSVWYMPATDEFICWGKNGYDGPQSVYDVETFTLRDRKWKESFPPGREKTWSNRRFPNWSTHGQWSRMKGWKGTVVKNVSDRVVGGYAATNRVSFVKTEGFLRPTRCPTFHQACWDSKRKRMVYFLGGKTFSYDPVKREWTYLNPEKSPAWCDALVWASLCYDAHNDEILLFGGGLALNEWGGAKTWIYDCKENTWKRPDFSVSALEKLRSQVTEVYIKLREVRCTLEYDIGQAAEIRKNSVTEALKKLPSISSEIAALKPLAEKEKEDVAANSLSDAAEGLCKLAETAPTDGAYERVHDLKAVENLLGRAERRLLTEPPLRCSTQMVYDSANKLVVLFGGNAQNARLCDTWVYDVTARTWKERYPSVSPPPGDVLSATYIDKHGLVMAAGLPAGWRRACAWTYDAAKNEWTPVRGSFEFRGGWLSLTYSTRDDVVMLNLEGTKSWGGHRVTCLYRFNPSSAAVKRKGVSAITSRLRLNWDARTRKLPPPKPEAVDKKLAELPANEWVQMPGPHFSRKTWGSAAIDTDRGVILYYGGGHSGYSGTDVAHYDIGSGRWSLSYPPEFPPFLEATNRTVFGWSYNLHPWAEHTRKWYAYDPVSRMMVYNRQGCFRPGSRFDQGNGPVTTAGYACWVYNPRLRTWYTPTYDRTFGTSDAQHLVTTPNGIYVHTRREGIWHCTVKKIERDGKVEYAAEWKQVIKKAPSSGNDLSGTSVYDSKRNRLVVLKTHAHMDIIDLNAMKVGRIKPERGRVPHYREACYIPEQDVIFSPNGYKKKGYSVYRSAENRWVQVDIPAPVMRWTDRRGKKHKRNMAYAGADTVIRYDPVHKVIFHYDRPNVTHLMLYDDKTVKVIKPKQNAEKKK